MLRSISSFAFSFSTEANKRRRRKPDSLCAVKAGGSGNLRFWCRGRCVSRLEQLNHGGLFEELHNRRSEGVIPRSIRVALAIKYGPVSGRFFGGEMELFLPDAEVEK